ncbi:PTS system, beta-glucoside-specific IIABC component [Williamsoniiplasma luminosum]|uniref:PTS system, beta-glucoside-specific IIABC component n=1 Tax=Williamsoniiplasma luminosum TaxID=214888 RepID=A0A2K8NUT7_9MOLU|nr:PTS transporter subunit EIIC [Williamsoniiplasma luminosum]ATZ17306.1 PTS system, beta-glucoside-specific IIABC component [Williamsoniiplasma luminosum]
MAKTKNKYDEFLKTTYEAVGGKENFGEIYHCVTRLRFKILDKTKVNEAKILEQKKQGLVKGINWLGNELQVIIGMEVSKVFDAFNNYLETLQTKPTTSGEIGEFKVEKVQGQEHLSVTNKLLNMIKGFVMPMIPAVIGLGIIVSIQAILALAKVIPSIQQMAIMDIQGQVIVANSFLQQKAEWIAQGGHNITFIIGILFYIGGTGAMSFLGILILFNGFKYLKLNPTFGAVLGFMLCAPSLILQGWNIQLVNVLDGWFKIKMGPVMGSIFVLIPAAFLFKYIKIGVDKVVPNLLNNLFAGAIALFITTVVVFIGLAPVIGIFENILGRAVNLLSEIPYGLGVMFYSLSWQFLVITGAHMTLVMLVMGPWLADSTAGMTIAIPMLMGAQIAAFGQMGAGLGIAVRTKDRMLKKQSIEAAIPCAFGVTEPMMFGVTLIRFKTLIFGCIGAGIGGLFFGIMKIPYFSQGGLGILAVMNTITGTLAGDANGGVADILWTLVTFAMAAGSACLITAFLFGQDGKVQAKQKIKKLTNLAAKYIALNNNQDLNVESFKAELAEIEKIQNDKEHIKLQQIYLKNDIKYNNFVAKLDKSEIKLDKLKEVNKSQKAITTLENKIQILKTKIAECEKQAKLQYENIVKINEQTINLINKTFENQNYDETLKALKNNYTNIINEVYKGEYQQPILEEVSLIPILKEGKAKLKIKTA